MSRLFAFDFHGTLGEGNEHSVLEVSNASLEKHGRKERFTIEHVSRLQGKPWAEYFQELCPDANEKEISDMVSYAKTFGSNSFQKYVKPVTNAKEVLEEIKRNGDTIIVISMATHNSILNYLKHIEIFHLIDDIIGITSEEEKSGNFDVGELKGSRLKAYAETGKFENIVMVGDTDDDVQAGKIAGALTFFYSPNGNVHNWADHSISNLNQILKK